MKQKAAKKERPKIPKKISRTYLENAGLYYLERYATSAENFRRVMMRKIKRSCDYHQTPIDEFTPMLDDLIARYISSGLLNDIVFTKAQVASLRRKGLGKQIITAKLAQKGVSRDKIAEIIEEIDAENENPELNAAILYIKRKKLGKYRTNQASDLQKARQKDLASLARAGFSYEVASSALNFDE